MWLVQLSEPTAVQKTLPAFSGAALITESPERTLFPFRIANSLLSNPVSVQPVSASAVHVHRNTHTFLWSPTKDSDGAELPLQHQNDATRLEDTP